MEALSPAVTGQATPVRVSRGRGPGGVETPPKKKKPDKWDHMIQHVDAFDHLLDNHDRAPAPCPTSPKTPRRPGGKRCFYFLLMFWR